jgi:hypothetical protein
MFDKYRVCTGVVYFVGPLMLHAAWWQALICAICMTAYGQAIIVTFYMTDCWYLTYCQRAVRFFGVAILLLGLCTWSGILPTTDQWTLSHHPSRGFVLPFRF